MLDKVSCSNTQHTLLLKSECINKCREISLLFSNKALSNTGEIITLKAIRTEGKIDEYTPPIKIFISVPKKKIKRAVDRNKIKRRIKEIFRNNKHLFPIQRDNSTLLVGFIYNSVKVHNFNYLKKEIIGLFTSLK